MMEFLTQISNHLPNVFTDNNLGISTLEILITIASLCIAFVIRGFFTRIILSKLINLAQKSGNILEDKFFDSLKAPLKTIPFISVFILFGIFINNNSYLGALIGKLNQTLITYFIFWFLHQSVVPISKTFKKLEKILSKALISWLTSSFKYLIIFLGITAILETWGIKIGPVIAGLGLFGVAVALGAQDLFKNLISGIMIILEKRFVLKDVIEIPGIATGTVEQIGFRSTLINQFDSTPISIPNYIFSDTSIINYSNRKHRRINWTVGLTYNTSIEQLKLICQKISESIHSNENFVINNSYQSFVRIEKFNDSSIDILISVFTNTTEWDRYLKIKEDLVLTIKEIVENNKSSFAYPSQTIYIEK